MTPTLEPILHYRTSYKRPSIKKFAPNSNVCYTDFSKTNNRTGLAYPINNNLYSKRHRNSASVFTTELQAMLQNILSNPSLLV